MTNIAQLFTELMDLTKESDTFYSQDFKLDGSTYRIFNYRLSSYTEFLRPSAMECRGIMFEVTESGAMLALVSRPMQKFFNLNENPSTMGLDLSNVDTVELKADGSLMSTYRHQGFLRLKSKGSLFSEQAIDSMKFLEFYHELNARLDAADLSGYTVNLEWCAPHNRIVIGYPKAHLKVLNARNRITGQYMSRDDLELRFGADVIDRVNTNGLDTAVFVQSIPKMTDDIEGYICRIGDLWFKVKTEKYMSLHHTKDSINNPRRLFEAVLDEGVDDLRSMFATDAVAIALIDVMQGKVVTMYNSMVTIAEQFYEKHKDEDRKTYAIAAQTVKIENLQMMSMLMNLYIGREPGYKAFLKARYKELGFRDTSLEVKND